MEYDAANTLRDLMCERTELESLLPHCIKDCSSVSVLSLSQQQQLMELSESALRDCSLCDLLLCHLMNRFLERKESECDLELPSKRRKKMSN